MKPSDFLGQPALMGAFARRSKAGKHGWASRVATLGLEGALAQLKAARDARRLFSDRQGSLDKRDMQEVDQLTDVSETTSHK